MPETNERSGTAQQLYLQLPLRDCNQTSAHSPEMKQKCFSIRENRLFKQKTRFISGKRLFWPDVLFVYLIKYFDQIIII